MPEKNKIHQKVTTLNSCIMAGAIHRQKKNRDFVTLDTCCLRDKRLRWGAKGLHSYLMQLPEDWQINISDLKDRSEDGRDATTSAMNALRATGYVLREQKTLQNGQFDGYDYHVFERPEHAADWVAENGFPENGLSENGKPVLSKYELQEELKGSKNEGEEKRVTAPPLPSLKDVFPFSEPKKENAPPVPPPPPNFGPAWPAVSDPYAWPTEASGPCPEQRGGNPADWAWVDDPAPAHVTTYAVPTSETFEAAPGGPTYRAEVHAPAEREVVTPKAKTPKAQPQPRAVEIPETHSAVAPELTRLLCKKHYLQKSAERLAAEMGWLFSKPVAFALRHIQDSLSSPKGAWAALDFTGCEDAFARWQKDERLRAQGQGGARINSQQGRFGDRAVITAYGNPDSPSYNQPQAF